MLEGATEGFCDFFKFAITVRDLLDRLHHGKGVPSNRELTGRR